MYREQPDSGTRRDCARRFTRSRTTAGVVLKVLFRSLLATALVWLTADSVLVETRTGESVTQGQGVPSGATPATGGLKSQVATIRGRVTRADTGRPLEGARVGTSSDFRVSFSDGNGRFQLTDLPAGRYSVIGSRTGFVTAYHGQRFARQGPRWLELAPGQVLEGVDLSLHPGSVISGSVMDEAGEPLPGARVWLVRQTFQDGQRRLVVSMGADAARLGSSGTVDLTDDRGMFRLFDIWPGTYYLAAARTDPSDRTRSRSPFWTDAGLRLFPGVTDGANATPFTVAAGDDLSGISFSLAPVRMATIRAFVRSADNQPGRPTVTVIHRDDLLGFSNSRQHQTRSDGSIEIRDLAPGHYSLVARADDRVGVAMVSLTGSDSVATVTLGAGWSMRGRLVVDGGSDRARLPASNVGIALRAEDPFLGVVRTEVSTDGTFSIGGLLGPHRVEVGLPDGWGLASVQRSGIDITDDFVDFTARGAETLITVTQQLTTVSGTVRDTRGAPAPDTDVLLFADDPRHWGGRSRFVRRASTDPAGRFAVQGLPPARYVAVALEYLESGEEANRAALEQLSGMGLRFTLSDREARIVDLRVERMP